MRRLDVLLLACLLLLFAVAASQDKADVNTITKVEVKGTTVEITGSKQPNFTTFTMTDPPRLVIDISEATFSGVAEEKQVGSGAISWIKTASYGSDLSAIARVLIGFSKDVETDLATVGTKVVVKILDGGPPAVAQAAKPQSSGRTESTARVEEKKEIEAPPQLQLASPASSSAESSEDDAKAVQKKQDAQAKEVAAKEKQDRIAKDRAEKEAAKRAEQQRLEDQKQAQAEKKRQVEEEWKRQVEQDRLAEQQRRAEAEKAKLRAVAERKQKAEEDRLVQEKVRADADEAKRQAAAEQKRKAEENRLAQQKAQADEDEAKRQAAAEQKRKVQEDRLAQEKARAEAAEAKRQAAVERKRKAQEDRLAEEKARAEAAETKRQAAAERKRKAQEEQLAQQRARAEAREAKRQAVAEQKRKLQEHRLVQKKARQEALAANREVQPARHLASSPVRTKTSAGRTIMTFVGFERGASASRVYVRTSSPVQYSVQQDGDKKVVLELENTRIGLHNNRRPLDTSFFDTAVAMVAPNPAAHRSVRVEIKLKEAASFHAKQDGNEVSVEFSPPAHP